MSKPSINWDHVAKHIVAMATDEDGYSWLYTRVPMDGRLWWHGGLCVEANAYTSFVPGTCDWRDSLVIRPGYEETTE